VLIQHERIPIRKAIWEMPAGQVDQLCGFGSFRDVALRELREETGYELAPDGETIFLGDFFSSPGFTDEREFLFLARPVQRAVQAHTYVDAEMILDCREFSPAQITAMIADDTIRDANTLSMWARLIAKVAGPVTWRCATSSNFASCRRVKPPSRFSNISRTCAGRS
jgi:ADP-ribose pyrophosphatase